MGGVLETTNRITMLYFDDSYIEEYQLEMADKLSLKRYPQQLTDVWLKMVKTYPKIYSINDYVDACRKNGLLIF